ncbi:MAG: 3-dehydroquinate synthase [Candidatus Caldatribacteriaceae bacterium]
MREITVSFHSGRSYPVFLAGDLFLQKEWFEKIDFPSCRGAVLTNDRVGELYAERVCRFFEKQGYSLGVVIVPDGEEYKSIKTVEEIYHKLLVLDLDRRSFLLALGGGVITDLAGFVASTFLRGIAYYQIPTSLLAQVDSSIGGKTGINLEEGKNLVGTFYQPFGVFIDLSFLDTLPEREYREGLAEVAKAAFLEGEASVNFLLEHSSDILQRRRDVLEEIVASAILFKKGIVERDEKEENLRSILNYGHTIGHALERALGYGVLRHGEAVSVGMMGEALLGEELRISRERVSQVQRELLGRFGLPLSIPQEVGLPEFLLALYKDKKKQAGRVRFALLEDLGRPVTGVEVEEGEILKVLRKICEVKEA